MTPEELVIEQKVQQLYASLPDWPQIPQNEMNQLCTDLLATDTVKRITMKQVAQYGEIDKKSYKEYCNACLFETLLSVLNNYAPSQGKFIHYFSISFKLNLQHELLEETNYRERQMLGVHKIAFLNHHCSALFLYHQKQKAIFFFARIQSVKSMTELVNKDIGVRIKGFA